MEERFETFTVLINRISRNIKKIKIQEMADYQLKSIHVSCLYYLYITNGLTSTELCDRCEEDKAAISRALNYLETEGYLDTSAKSTKHYKYPLVLTEKGRHVGEVIANKINAVLQEINGSMTEDERRVFYRNLTAISNRLDAIAHEQVHC